MFLVILANLVGDDGGSAVCLKLSYSSKVSEKQIHWCCVAHG
jgi:hypothetical protein